MRTPRQHLPSSGVTISVRCNGHLHQLTWQRGRLTAKDHQPDELRFTALLGSPSRCAAILTVVQSGARPLPSLVPRALKRAIRMSDAATPHVKTTWVSPDYASMRSPHNGKHLEARGRNGWFQPSSAGAWLESAHNNRQAKVVITINSDHSYGVIAPIFLRGPHQELLRLFQQMTTALTQLSHESPSR